MFCDYHIHVDKLDWSIDTIREMYTTAQKSGVDEIGIVVHTKCLKGFEPLYNHILTDGEKHKKLNFEKDIDDYITLLNTCKEYGYPVKTGIEVCYSPEAEDFLREKLIQYPFDFIIGSVHLIGRDHFKTAIENYNDRRKVGRMYYDIVLKAIESRLFNIIGHIELARRENIPGMDFFPDLLDSICDALVLNNCAVEINTKWLVRHGNIIPDRITLEYMANKGVELVFGSDAHHINRIGFAREVADAAIMEAGFKGFSCI